jgi:NOL1/NOP2/fmu family ribosome biogenesis protein
MAAKIVGSGWAVVTYRSLPLGWIKLLQNRVNNYYPKEWRILNK